MLPIEHSLASSQRSTRRLRQAATDEVLTGYERAFASRSTWAERQTVIDHLRDLLDLIPDPDARRPHLRARHH